MHQLAQVAAVGTDPHKAALRRSDRTNAIRSPRGDHTGDANRHFRIGLERNRARRRSVCCGDPEVRVPPAVRHEHDLALVGAHRRHLNVTRLPGDANRRTVFSTGEPPIGNFQMSERLVMRPATSLPEAWTSGST